MVSSTVFHTPWYIPQHDSATVISRYRYHSGPFPLDEALNICIKRLSETTNVKSVTAA